MNIIPRRVLSINPEGDRFSCTNYQISAIKMNLIFVNKTRHLVRAWFTFYSAVSGICRVHFHDFSASFLAKISSSETVAKRDAKYREVMTSQKVHL